MLLLSYDGEKIELDRQELLSKILNTYVTYFEVESYNFPSKNGIHVFFYFKVIFAIICEMFSIIFSALDCQNVIINF